VPVSQQLPEAEVEISVSPTMIAKVLSAMHDKSFLMKDFFASSCRTPVPTIPGRIQPWPVRLLRRPGTLIKIG
jgi:hypothetical protein